MTNVAPFRPTVIEVEKRGPAGPALGDMRGAWSAGTYRRRALVTHQGSLWLALRDTSGTPGDHADWQLVVAAGDLTPSAQAALDEALAALDLAEAAVATGLVSKDTKALLDAVVGSFPDGAKGEVTNDPNPSLIGEYRRESGVWVKKSGATVPALDVRTAGIEEDGGLSGYLWRLLSKLDRKQLVAIEQDGSLSAKYPGGLRFEQADTVEGHLGRFVAADGSVVLAFHGDGTVEGKLSSPLLSGAIVELSHVNYRIKRSLSETGDLLQPCLNSWRLVELHQRLRRLSDGDTGAQLVLNLYGDSWTDSVPRWSGRFVEQLVARYGDAGPGWVGFAFNPAPHNNARPSVVSTAVSAGWTADWYTGGGPDLGSITSSTSGAKVTVTGPAGLTSVHLFAEGTADGEARYRWNGGSWSSVSLVGSGLLIESLTGIPAGVFSLEIEVISGSSKLFGLDLRNSNRGVRVNKLGCSGSTSSAWATGTAAATWAPAISALNANAHFLMLGTNDQQRPWYPIDFAHYLGVIVDAIRATDPLSGVALMHPPENPREPQVQPMAALTAAARELAIQKGCASLDLQYVFGDGSDPASYGDGSSRPWFEPDDIHPTQQGGAPTIAAAVMYHLFHLTL